MSHYLRLNLPALLCAAPLCAGLPAGLLPAADHRPDVPQPVLGQRYTSHDALLAYVKVLAVAAPDRVRLSTLNVS